VVEIENDRITRVFNWIGRALYYNYFNEKWLGGIEVHTEYHLYWGNKSLENNKHLVRYTLLLDKLFNDSPYFGENPEVFKYQVKTGKHGNRYMRLYFYEYSKVSLLFKNRKRTSSYIINEV